MWGVAGGRCIGRAFESEQGGPRSQEAAESGCAGAGARGDVTSEPLGGLPEHSIHA